MVKLIIFDFDGVIIDSKHLMLYAFKKCYEKNIGNDQPPYNDFLSHMGEPLDDIFRKVGLSQEMVPYYNQICSDHIDQIALYPNTIEMLTQITSLNVPIVLFTGKNLRRTMEILHHLHIYDFFKFIITPESIWKAKPNPEGILYALNLMGCKHKDAIMIGDSINDITAARKAGVKSVGFCWETVDDIFSLEKYSDYFIRNWHNFTLLIQKIMQ